MESAAAKFLNLKCQATQAFGEQSWNSLPPLGTRNFNEFRKYCLIFRKNDCEHFQCILIQLSTTTIRTVMQDFNLLKSPGTTLDKQILSILSTFKFSPEKAF